MGYEEEEFLLGGRAGVERLANRRSDSLGIDALGETELVELVQEVVPDEPIDDLGLMA